MVWRAGGGSYPTRRAPSSSSLYSSNSYGTSPPNGTKIPSPLSSSADSPPNVIGPTSMPWRTCGLRMSHQGSFIGPYSSSTGSRSGVSFGELGMSSSSSYQEVDRKPLERTWSDDVVRVVCISDTHSLHPKIADLLPQGDVLIHGGDFSNTGTKHQVEAFRDFLKAVPHTHKIVVAGNHDLTFHEPYYESIGQQKFHSKAREGPYFPAECRRLVTDLKLSHQVFYLEDSEMYIPGTPLRVWGTPWTPAFGDWAFGYEPRGEFCKNLYAGIPEGVDLLISHGPPFHVGDKISPDGKHVGCPELLREVKTRVKPRVHIFGHIHECHGVFQDEEGILYLNASTCNLQYRPSNAPIVLDIPRDRSKPVQVVSDHTINPIDLSGRLWDFEGDGSDSGSGVTTEEELDLELETAASNLSLNYSATFRFDQVVETQRGITPPIKEEEGPVEF